MALGIAMSTAQGDLLQAFAREVAATPQAGKAFRTPGLGTFSTCTRRATRDRPASTMAMFRASAELRAYAAGGSRPTFSGPHAAAVRAIVRGMLTEEGITLPQLGRMAVVPVPRSRPKLIFHGSKELNAVLAGMAVARGARDA